MTTCAEWAAKLAAAEAALHKLNLGRGVASIGDGEDQITYSKANRTDLMAYIEYLQAKVDSCNGRRAFRRRAFGVIPQG